MEKLDKYLFATSHQKIVGFLVNSAGEEYTEKEISKATGVKKSAVNLALRDLARENFLEKRKVGRTSLYKADADNNAVKEIKKLRNILRLLPLVKNLSVISHKIILFGSFADGTNRKDSDIDLFVMADDISKIRKAVNSSPLSEKVQLIAKSPKEMLKINKSKPVFFQEIEKGTALWEINEE